MMMALSVKFYPEHNLHHNLIHLRAEETCWKAGEGIAQ